MIKNIIGLKFGRLTVIKRVENDKNNHLRFLCHCDCGNEIIINKYSLTANITKSCGCLQKETQFKKGLNPKNKTHNLSKHKLYKTYYSIKNRCYNKNDKSYSIYGFRNIKMCEEWKNDFKSFYDWAISNGYNDNLTIDRINVNGNYEPDNCRWITRKEQNRNTRRNKLITYNGETHCVSEWAEILNMSVNCIQGRLKRNWSLDKIFL